MIGIAPNKGSPKYIWAGLSTEEKPVKAWYDVTYSDKAGASLFGTSARGSFIRIDASIRLDGDQDDYMDILVQDSLTGLSSFFINAQGYSD